MTRTAAERVLLARVAGSRGEAANLARSMVYDLELYNESSIASGFVPRDAILVSGMLGDHGVAIMSLRENLTFETTIESDTAALHGFHQ